MKHNGNTAPKESDMHSTALTDQIAAALDLPTLDAFAALHELCEAERGLRRDAVAEGDWATADAALDRITGPLTDAARTLCPRAEDTLSGRGRYTATVAEQLPDADGGRACAQVPTVYPGQGLTYTEHRGADRDTLAAVLDFNGITLV